MPPEGFSSPLLDELQADLASALEKHAEVVECVYLFGSAARAEAGPLSDLDLAILFPQSFSPGSRLEIAAELSARMQRIEGPRVDVVILNEAPPALQHRVIRDGCLLFVRDEARRVAFEARALREYLDFLPVLERYDQALLARARKGRLGC